MVVFSQTESQLNSLQIEEIEKCVRLDFPIDYKNHLLKYNGGQCSPSIFKFYENKKWTESCIDWFLAIYDGEYDNLKNILKLTNLIKKRLPTHILPIALDPGGNLICISCGAEDKGSIYFWDHENEVNYDETTDADYSNLYFVAKSLNELIVGLKEEFA
jgi:hypothetical protein